MGEVGKALGRNFGGMPAWAWLGIFAVGMLAFRTLRRPPAASPSASGPAATSESSGPTVPIILAPLSTRTRTVAVVPVPGPAPARPAHLSAEGAHAWTALLTWWAGGGAGTPPDATGVTQDRERRAYESALQWYVQHPAGTAPPGVYSDVSGYTVQTFDPTVDGYGTAPAG